MAMKWIGIIFLSFTLVSTAAAQERIYRIHCDQTPPFIYWDENAKKVTGLWAEVFRATMRRMGTAYEELRIYTWPRLLDMGLRGDLDGIFSAVKTEERMKYMWYPDEPLLVEPWILWIRKADKETLRFESYEDLEGHRIGVMRDYHYSTEFWNFIKKEQNFEEVSREILNFRKLIEGRVDFIASSLHVGIFIAREEGLLNRIHPLADKPISNSEFYAIFNKKQVSPDWVDRFSENLAAFKKTDDYQNLLSRFGLSLEEASTP